MSNNTGQVHGRAEAERVAAAEAAAARRECMVMERIVVAKASAISEVGNAAAEVATAAARAVVAEALTAEAADAMVDAAINDLPLALRAV